MIFFIYLFIFKPEEKKELTLRPGIISRHLSIDIVKVCRKDFQSFREFLKCLETSIILSTLKMLQKV